MTPWEHHPALSRDRLVAIGERIQAGRNNALDRYDPTVGCTAWTLGCEAFAFQMHEITEAAVDYDWLEVLDPSMQFVFSIGGVPMRFYRGAPDEPTKRTLRQTFPEFEQLGLFSAEELIHLTREPLYRFAVETDLDGSVTTISFVVLSGDLPILVWEIPLGDAITRLSPTWVDPQEGVELPPPAVTVGDNKRDDKSGTQG